MDEEKETEEKESEKPVSDADKGSKSETTTLVDEANTAAERLEKANERKTELLRQEEELMAKKALGGRAEAGQVEKKELTPQEYADEVMKGNIPKE